MSVCWSLAIRNNCKGRLREEKPWYHEATDLWVFSWFLGGFFWSYAAVSVKHQTWVAKELLVLRPRAPTGWTGQQKGLIKYCCKLILYETHKQKNKIPCNSSLPLHDSIAFCMHRREEILSYPPRRREAQTSALKVQLVAGQGMSDHTEEEFCINKGDASINKNTK